jgi:hypothetical protein
MVEVMSGFVHVIRPMMLQAGLFMNDVPVFVQQAIHFMDCATDTVPAAFKGFGDTAMALIRDVQEDKDISDDASALHQHVASLRCLAEPIDVLGQRFVPMASKDDATQITHDLVVVIENMPLLADVAVDCFRIWQELKRLGGDAGDVWSAIQKKDVAQIEAILDKAQDMVDQLGAFKDSLSDIAEKLSMFASTALEPAGASAPASLLKMVCEMLRWGVTAVDSILSFILQLDPTQALISISEDMIEKIFASLGGSSLLLACCAFW